MRSWLIFPSLLIAACSTVSAEGSDSAGGKCSAEDLQEFAGQPATEQTGAAILHESGADILRWIPHGSAVTMDFRPDRVNVKLSPQNQIEEITCG
jgi:hypothetical protein